MKMIWEKIKNKQIFLDGTEYPLLINPSEVENYYLPIAQILLTHVKQNKRVLIAVAGPPGCGKSSLAAILNNVINTLVGKNISIVAGLDGWHFTNKYLEEHTLVRSGASIELKQIKGDPATYDHSKIKAFLNKVSSGESVSFPVYSREKHDPIENAGLLNKNHLIVILEGNYWLLDQQPWVTFQNYFDYRIAITASPDNLVSGLRERHLRGGKDPDWVEKQIQNVDLVNINLVLSHQLPADLIIKKRDNFHIENIQWVGNESLASTGKL